MAHPYQQLVNDHTNLRSLLRFLRNEIRAYDDVMVETDVALVMEALEYMVAYPQLYHHPLEEAAMDFVSRLGLGDANLFATIRSQHLELEQKTADLEKTFELIYNDHVVPIEHVKAQLNEYLDLQFQHLDTEDNYLFPILERGIDEQGWEEVALEVAERPDPLFMKRQVESYSELSRHLGMGGA